MSNTFSVKSEARGDLTVLALEGYLDAHTAPQFESAIQDQIDKGNLRLIVDGGDLSYISSAGLGVFMGFVEELREGGGDLKICSLPANVQEIFDLLGFTNLFHVEPDVEAAEARFASDPVFGG